MRLDELQNFSQGKYIGLKLAPQTISDLTEYCEANAITGYPNDFHITLAKSRVDFPWVAGEGLSWPHTIKPRYELRTVQAMGTILILQLFDHALINRFRKAKEQGAQAGKKPRLHLTLSYKFRGKLWDLPMPTFPIIVDSEYVTPLLDPTTARKSMGIG